MGEQSADIDNFGYEALRKGSTWYLF